MSSLFGERHSSADAAELQLYRLAVEMADNVAARRGNSSRFFLAANVSVVALVGALHPDLGLVGGGVSAAFPAILVSLAGLLVAATWWLAMRAYRDMGEAKLAVITEAERSLPLAIYQNEEAILGLAGTRLGTIAERVIPLLFGLLFLASLASLVL